METNWVTTVKNVKDYYRFGLCEAAPPTLLIEAIHGAKCKQNL